MKFKFNDVLISLAATGAISNSSFFNNGVMQEVSFFGFLIAAVLLLIRGDILNLKDSINK